MFSAAKTARLAKNALRNAQIIRKIPISMPPRFVGKGKILRLGHVVGNQCKSLSLKVGGVFGKHTYSSGRTSTEYMP